MPLARAPIREFATEGDIEKYGPERAAELARERTEKLADLKQRVRDAGLPVFDYPTRWDAGRQGLVGLEEFGEAVYHDLLASIDDEFGTEPTAELDWFAEESAAMEAFIEERTERYVVGSRQALLDEMAAFAAGSREPSVLVVTGEPGSGKSALLGRFYRDHAAADADEIVIPHFVGASQGSTSIRLTLRRLCHELAQAAGIEDEIPEDIRELVQAFPEFLQRAAGGLEARPTDGRRVVLTIDALNQLDATDNAHALNWLPRQLPEGVRIICSSLEHPALEALRRRAQQLRELVCAPLTEADAAAIMDGVLARYRKRFDEAQRQALLAKQDAGNPLYLLAALEELRTLGTYELITARIAGLPGTVTGLFNWILQRLAEGIEGQEAFGEDLVSAYTSYIAIGRGGMTEDELQALCAPVDAEGEFRVLHRMLRPYLMRRGELVDYFHGQLREAVERRYLRDEATCQQRHREIAGHLQSGGYGHLRTLSELPYHLRLGETWEALSAVLEDLDFVAAKVGANMLHELIEEYAFTLSAMPCWRSTPDGELCQFQAFLRQQASVFRRYPRSVLQQALLADQSVVRQRAHGSTHGGPLLVPRGQRPPRRSEGATLMGHSRAVRKCLFLSRGTRLASCGQDGRLTIHGIPSLREEWCMMVDDAPCYDFAVSPDEQVFWVCADSGLYLCDSSDSSKTALVRRQEAPWLACHRRSEGTGLLLGSASGRLALLPDGGSECVEITHSPLPVGTWLLSEAWGVGLPALPLSAPSIVFCSVENGACRVVPTQSTATAGAVCSHGDCIALSFMETRVDATILSAGSRGGGPHSIRHLGRAESKLETRSPDMRVIGSRPVADWMVEALSYSREGTHLCGAGAGHVLHFWSAEDLTLVAGVKIGGAQAVCIDLSEQVERVAVGGIDGIIRIFEDPLLREPER